MRRYYWTKQPFSEAGTAHLAEHLWAGIRALTTGPKKVLVLDLDNTLWGGVVGETGPLGVALGDGADGEAFRAFQKHAKELTERGVVLAIASKNNPKDAQEPFETNPEMVLKLDDFAAMEICWDPKGTTHRPAGQDAQPRARQLRLLRRQPRRARAGPPGPARGRGRRGPRGPRRIRPGPPGRPLVRDHRPERRRPRAGRPVRRRAEAAGAGAVVRLDGGLPPLAGDDRRRPRAIDEADLPRVVQLLAKTNQFNLTTRRHTREDVLDLLGPPRSVGMTVRLARQVRRPRPGRRRCRRPRDGTDDTLRIDTWLMSCRVIGRTVEQFLFGLLLDRGPAARAIGGSSANTSRRRRTPWSPSCTTTSASAGSARESDEGDPLRARPGSGRGPRARSSTTRRGVA